MLGTSQVRSKAVERAEGVVELARQLWPRSTTDNSELASLAVEVAIRFRQRSIARLGSMNLSRYVLRVEVAHIRAPDRDGADLVVPKRICAGERDYSVPLVRTFANSWTASLEYRKRRT